MQLNNVVQIGLNHFVLPSLIYHHLLLLVVHF